MFMPKIEDGAELSPDLVTEINYEAMELTLSQYMHGLLMELVMYI